MRPAVSIITLTCNRLAVTRRCLPTWLETVPPARGWEMIVVDNGSSDGTVQWLDEFAASAAAAGIRVRIIRNPRNAGCSTGRNQGAAAAAGEYLGFLDNDVAVRSRQWLALLLRALAAPAKAVIAGPKLLYPFPPYRVQCAGVGISPRGQVRFRGRGEERADNGGDPPTEVQCLISACWIMRRAAFVAAGGFDEQFNPVQFEDFDLCYRLREKGGKCLYVPAAEMYHYESTTTAGSDEFSNARVVVTHGLRFKERWRHMFARENGPADADCRWRQIRIPPLAAIPPPPLWP